MNIIEIDKDTAKQIALAEYLKCDYTDLEQDTNDHYGLTTFDESYAIGTEEEADEAAKEYVKGILWAFNSDFILDQCKLPSSMKKAFDIWKTEECESCNDDLEDIIDRLCGIDDFVDAAVSSDGRGSFLGTYSGDEDEINSDLLGEVYYVYRI